MQIALHVGAHCTDDGKLAATLLNNREDFLERRVSVPPLRRYQVLLRESLHALLDGPPAPEAHEILMDAILQDDIADRVVLTNESFFGTHRMVMKEDQFYPMAEQRIVDLRQLFPTEEISLHMAIRDPGPFIAATHAASGASMSEILDGTEPARLRWSDLITRIRGVAPDMPITVWCSEDSPLIWPEIIRDMASLPVGEKIKGGFDLLKDIMSPEGMKRFRTYFKAHPVMADHYKRRVMMVFLDKYAREEAIEDDVELPDWPAEIFDFISDAYEQDLDVIEAIPGVTLLSP
ncbi:hypothetical protein ACRARG_04800 [Pseudooceanicola sp. C21-150M6]|uniref:hypothetical protein n=1 Tax=Pseudooceanicola sp. C21-150M6 TaxID=3434355 RepID=UPI003D7FEE04